jgi:lipid II:glycine glycyltransferase (peptidoglycan interpeptide bridge formation enzyme)
MKIKELNKEEYLRLSNELNVHPLQSFAWGELKRPVWTPLRLGVFDGDECVSLLTILKRKIPLIGKELGYIPRGIVIKDEKYYQEIIISLVGAEDLLPLSFILIDPEVFQIRNTCLPAGTAKYEIRDESENRNKKFESIVDTLKNSGFKEDGRQEQPIRTVVMDLTKSEEEILAEMKSKHRQYIRKAERKGVTIEKGNDESINDFCRIIEQIIKEKNYVMHESDYYRKVWKLFREDNLVEMFIAKLKGEVVGTYMLLFSKDGVYEMYGGCNSLGNKNLVNYLMKWETIKYSKSIGKKYYDQWGAEFAHPGLVQFKEGFGGQVVEYPKQFVYMNDKIGYWMYKVLRKIDRIRRG